MEVVGGLSLESIPSSLPRSSGILFDDIKRESVVAVDSNQEDEGEIMLLAMILLQLHGVKLPSSSLEEGTDSLNKKKRQRTSPEQLAILEQIFITDKMPNQQTRVHLADQLGMSSRRVQIWFQNKRAKVKRSASKHEGGDDTIQLHRRDSISSSVSSSPPSSPSSPSVPTDELSSPSSSSPSSPLLVPQLHSFSADALNLSINLSKLSNNTTTLPKMENPLIALSNSLGVANNNINATSNFTLSAW